MSFDLHELFDKGCITGNRLQFVNAPGFRFATVAHPYAEHIGNIMLVGLLGGASSHLQVHLSSGYQKVDVSEAWVLPKNIWFPTL